MADRATPSAPAPTRGLARPAAPTTAPAPAATDQYDIVPVLYGTDRNRRDQTKPQRVNYGSDRAYRLELGQALVTVPKNHTVPNIERPDVWRVPFTNIVIYEEAEDRNRHFTIAEIGSLTEEEFLRRARSRLARSRTFENHALVFVHGFNNSFDYALYRTAQIAYDLKFDGQPFLYSWPAGEGLFTYAYNQDSADQAVRYFGDFLRLVAEKTGATSVSVIAHSMGTRVLLPALDRIKRDLPESVRLNQVIMAAPDYDRGGFVALANDVRALAKNWTLYASSSDRALLLSRTTHANFTRAGDVPPEGPLIVEGIDTIDISAANTSYFDTGHALYAERPELLVDIGKIVQTGERPPEVRFPLHQRVESTNGTYWRYAPTR
jgi:esterase/lipase superfamily enzyme